MEATTVPFTGVGQDGSRFNRIFLQSNTRVLYKADGSNGDTYHKCGAGMECSWWIDDLIVNDARIGEEYYNMLKSGGGAKPLAPQNVKVR